MKTLTVFTPAYNRAYSLPLCYESLKRQTSKDFIWLIIDDGSSDGTDELVKSWQKENNGFDIQYIYKENGGMHTAHNTAYENIKTELNVCIDSDDYMTDDAVEKIVSLWKEKGNEKYAGIIALDCTQDGKVIGSLLDEDLNETTLKGFYSRGGKGDKKLIYRTEVMNAYPPYPVFEGEKYVSIAYKYYLADEDYSLLIMNEPVCVVEYMQDGSSTNMYKQYLKNPKGFAFIRKVDMAKADNFKELMRCSIHYVSSSIISKNKRFISESPKKFATVIALPLGFALTLYIKKKSKGFLDVNKFNSKKD